MIIKTSQLINRTRLSPVINQDYLFHSGIVASVSGESILRDNTKCPFPKTMSITLRANPTPY